TFRTARRLQVHPSTRRARTYFTATSRCRLAESRSTSPRTWRTALRSRRGMCALAWATVFIRSS
ncbi:hypothetical protein T492DRAFT_1006540, partial [Pavlovales sp. CCMP2436]